MIDIITGIAEAVFGFFEFIGSSIQELIYIGFTTTRITLDAPNYLRFLPTPVLAFVVPLLSIVVLYKIFGREG